MSDRQSPSDDRGLAGKVGIVTGGGAPDDGIGNGRAAAILLARAGARVLVVDILREAAEQTVAMIEQEGGSAAAFVADVADERQCQALVEAAVGQFGRLDGVHCPLVGQGMDGGEVEQVRVARLGAAAS